MTDDSVKTANKRPAGPTKEYQLLTDGMVIDGEHFDRGELVTLDAKHGDRLQKEFGAVAAPGTLERRAKAEAEIARIRAEAEQSLAAADAEAPAATVNAVPAPQDNSAESPRRQVRRGDN